MDVTARSARVVDRLVEAANFFERPRPIGRYAEPLRFEGARGKLRVALRTVPSNAVSFILRRPDRQRKRIVRNGAFRVLQENRVAIGDAPETERMRETVRQRRADV